MVRCCTGSTTYRHRSVRGALATVGTLGRVGVAERSAAERSTAQRRLRAMPCHGRDRTARLRACCSLHGATLHGLTARLRVHRPRVDVCVVLIFFFERHLSARCGQRSRLGWSCRSKHSVNGRTAYLRCIRPHGRQGQGLPANHLVNDAAILVEDVLAVVVCLRHLTFIGEAHSARCACYSAATPPQRFVGPLRPHCSDTVGLCGTAGK